MPIVASRRCLMKTLWRLRLVDQSRLREAVLQAVELTYLDLQVKIVISSLFSNPPLFLALAESEKKRKRPPLRDISDCVSIASNYSNESNSVASIGKHVDKLKKRQSASPSPAEPTTSNHPAYSSVDNAQILILSSYLDNDQSSRFQEFCKLFGVSTTNVFESKVTHLVVPVNDKKLFFHRTMKYMEAVMGRLISCG
jgi:hypothetical protein